MFFVQPTSFEIWEWLYVFYLLWGTGVMLYVLFISMSLRDRNVVTDVQESTLLLFVIGYGFLSAMLVAYGFPLLWLLPLWAWDLGAPVGAVVLMVLWMVGCLVLSGQLLYGGILHRRLV